MRVTKTAQKELNRILTAFESGAVEAAIAKTALPSFNVPSNKWSFTNRLLQFLAGTEDGRGIGQWRTAGRRIKKGTKAFYILVPLQSQKVIENEKTGDEEKVPVLVGFKACPIFRVEDTEGDPLPYHDLEPSQPPPLMNVAEAWGIEVNYLPGGGPAWGYYAPGRSEIGLSTHDEGVFFHELAHVAHERVSGTLKAGKDWEQEAVAELTSAVLMHLYGKTPDDGGAYRYIRSYAEKAGKDVHRACLSVVSDVGQCLDAILTAAEADPIRQAA
jgi:antirestriction protein ArdC